MFGSWKRKGPLALFLQNAANPRCNVVQPFIDDVISMMSILDDYGHISTIRRQINYRNEKNNARNCLGIACYLFSSLREYEIPGQREVSHTEVVRY